MTSEHQGKKPYFPPLTAVARIVMTLAEWL